MALVCGATMLHLWSLDHGLSGLYWMVLGGVLKGTLGGCRR